MAINHSRAHGSTHNVRTARLTILWSTLTETTLVTPSFPGCSSVTRPRFHVSGAVVSISRTRLPGINLADPCWLHLVRFCKVLKYSFDQRLQNCCRICSTSCQRVSRLVLTSMRSGSGIEVRGDPIKKWPGVSTSKSLGSAEAGTRGANSGTPLYTPRQ